MNKIFSFHCHSKHLYSFQIGTIRFLPIILVRTLNGFQFVFEIDVKFDWNDPRKFRAPENMQIKIVFSAQVWYVFKKKKTSPTTPSLRAFWKILRSLSRLAILLHKILKIIMASQIKKTIKIKEYKIDIQIRTYIRQSSVLTKNISSQQIVRCTFDALQKGTVITCHKYVV